MDSFETAITVHMTCAAPHLKHKSNTTLWAQSCTLSESQIRQGWGAAGRPNIRSYNSAEKSSQGSSKPVRFGIDSLARRGGIYFEFFFTIFRARKVRKKIKTEEKSFDDSCVPFVGAYYVRTGVHRVRI